MAEDDTRPASGGRESRFGCKVDRGIYKYDLGDEFNETLSFRYKDGESLRDLERVINREFVAAAVDGHGAGENVSGDVVVDASVSEIVDVLRETGDVSSRDAARVRTRLEQSGVDVERLEKDLVSYRTVQKHLNECLDVDTSREETITVPDASRTIQWAVARCEAVVKRTIGRLERVGLVRTSGDVSVDAVVRVSCDECGATMTVSEFLDNDGCDCD